VAQPDSACGSIAIGERGTASGERLSTLRWPNNNALSFRALCSLGKRRPDLQDRTVDSRDTEDFHRYSWCPYLVIHFPGDHYIYLVTIFFDSLVLYRHEKKYG
jgi:hypothetical protein